jgi:hypothetical protein
MMLDQFRSFAMIFFGGSGNNIIVSLQVVMNMFGQGIAPYNDAEHFLPQV